MFQSQSSTQISSSSGNGSGGIRIYSSQSSTKNPSTAPILEHAIFHLQPSVSQERWWQQQHAVQALLDVAAGCYGYISGFSTTPGVSDFVVLVGWESQEAHETWFAEQMQDPDSVLNNYGELTIGTEFCYVQNGVYEGQ